MLKTDRGREHAKKHPLGGIYSNLCAILFNKGGGILKIKKKRVITVGYAYSVFHGLGKSRDMMERTGADVKNLTSAPVRLPVRRTGPDR